MRSMASADPWTGGTRDVTVVEALDAAAQEVAAAFATQPEVEASMHVVLGETYLGLGRLEPATAQVTRAREMHEGLGDTDPRSLAALEILSGDELHGVFCHLLVVKHGQVSSLDYLVCIHITSKDPCPPLH